MKQPLSVLRNELSLYWKRKQNIPHRVMERAVLEDGRTVIVIISTFLFFKHMTIKVRPIHQTSILRSFSEFYYSMGRHMVRKFVIVYEAIEFDMTYSFSAVSRVN